ncbi:uncharacterized protein trim33l [Leuresthes tenuis]|uniref:uncharacterized protein trim33l n=1 Tax=Leuresthes tenuis TaxID=355514 RepID=UPI003B50CCA7
MGKIRHMKGPGEELPQAQICSNCDGLAATCWCLDCNEALCDECVSAHRRVTLTRSHRLLNQLPEEHSLISPTKFCRLHPFEPLKLFCFTCRQLTCRDCQLVAHMNHRSDTSFPVKLQPPRESVCLLELVVKTSPLFRFQFANEALESLREELDACIQPLRAQMDASRKSLQDMDKSLEPRKPFIGGLGALCELRHGCLGQHRPGEWVTLLRLPRKVYSRKVCELERERLNMRMLKVKQLQQSYTSAAENAEKARNTTELLALVANISQISSQVKDLSEQDPSPPATMSDLMVIVNKQTKQKAPLHTPPPPSGPPPPPPFPSATLRRPLTALLFPVRLLPPPPPPMKQPSVTLTSKLGPVAALLHLFPVTLRPPLISIVPPPPYASHSFSSSRSTRLASTPSFSPPTSGPPAPPVRPTPSVSPSNLLHALLSSCSCSSAAGPPTSTCSHASIRADTPPISCVSPPSQSGLPPSSSVPFDVNPPASQVQQQLPSSRFDPSSSSSSSVAAPSNELPSPATTKGPDSAIKINVLTKSQVVNSCLNHSWKMRKKKVSKASSSTSIRPPSSTKPSSDQCRHPSTSSAAVLPSSLCSSSTVPSLVSCPAPTSWICPQTAPSGGQCVAVQPLKAGLPQLEGPSLSSITCRPVQSSLVLNKELIPSQNQSSILLLSDPRTVYQVSNSSLGLLSAAPQRCDLVFFSIPQVQKNGDGSYFGPVSLNLQALPGTSGGDAVSQSHSAPTSQQILGYRSSALPHGSPPNDLPKHPDLNAVIGSGQQALGEDELSAALSDDTEPAGKRSSPTSTFSEVAEPLRRSLSSVTSDSEAATASEDSQPLWLSLEKSDSEREEPRRSGTQRDLSSLRCEPRVSLVKLPVSLPARGRPLPRFRLTLGDKKDEVYVEEITGDSQSIGDMLDDITDDSEVSDDNSDVTRDFTMPLSSPMSLEVLSCSACGSPDSSKICSACGRGYHRDCHVPPVGPDIWSEWICSLCQDLSDPSDPYSADRPEGPQRTGLSLQDQRRCESLLLHLKVEGCSRLSEFGFWSDLVMMSERLTQHRSPPYQTAAQLVSDIWSLFEDVSQDDALHKLQQSFQEKLMESLGSELHPSLLIAPNAETPPSAGSPLSSEEESDTSRVEEEAELMWDSKIKNLRKRLRDFLGLKSQSAAKREKRE